MVPESEVKKQSFPYERQAMNGDEMPDGLSYPDQIMFLSLRMVYAQLKQGIIDRDTAVRDKKKLVKEYEQYSYVEQIGKEWVDIIRRTELARSEYRKSRTLENADQLLFAIDGGDFGKKAGAQG